MPYKASMTKVHVLLNTNLIICVFYEQQIILSLAVKTGSLFHF